MKQNENLTEINLGHENYEDFRGSLYFRAFRIEDLEFTVKHVTLKDNSVVPLVHVSGVQVTTGKKVDFDMWPRNNATSDDLVKLPDGAKLTDIDFRVGYWIEKTFNEETGAMEKKIVQGAPKWIAASVGGAMFGLSGEQRKYGA